MTNDIGAPAPPEQLRLEQLNRAAQDEFVELLRGTYEHSPWVAERAGGGGRSRAWRR
jgi:2-oxo-4-hydroxy-4-carboxy--5-ureidoimidazoline (OHCU) decarboxylase